MSEYECVVVPEMEWNLRRQQRQAEQVVQGLEEKHKGMGNHHHQQHYNIDNNINSRSSSHVFQQNPHPIMSNNTIEELTWENGQLSMCGHRDTTKPVWPGSNDTLESIVHQASHNKTNPIYVIDGHHLSKMGDEKNKHFISSSSSSGQKITVETSGADQTESILMMKKRPRSESEQCGTNNTNLFSNSSSYSKGDHYHQAGIDPSFCGSASATFCKDEGTMMTWPSFDSSRNLKSKKTFHPAEDSASLGISANQDEDGKTKTDQTGRSHSSRRSSRVAANHNQSERKRRDRINQKMRALQRLVPNAYKTDKASMLDEVIEYLKQLQAQVETMMSMRNINVPHFTMMPLAGIAQAQQQQQQQLQLSLFSRMVGLGMGMGMVNANSVARAAAAQPPPPLMHSVIPPQFAMQSPPNPPPAVVPVAHPTVPEKTGTRSNVPSLPILDPFMSAFLAQNMNIDLYNRMAAAVYRQQQMGNPSTTHQLGREE